MITPIFTEKSLKLAKEGKYTFWVDRRLNKLSLKAQIAKAFAVHVVSIKTITTSGEVKRNNKGMKIRTLSGKKAIVTLKNGEKIKVFEESKK